VGREAAVKRAVVLLLLCGCRYGGQLAREAEVDENCRSVCADSHASCVRNGEARKWGLPGVTFDLCQRELDDCRARCRAYRESPRLVREVQPVDAGDAEFARTLEWQQGESVVRCPGGSPSVSFPPNLLAHVKRERVLYRDIDTILYRDADAVLMIRSGQGEPAFVAEEWLGLQSLLTHDSPSFHLDEMNVRANGQPWDADYLVRVDGKQVKYRAVGRTVARGGGTYCRAIAIERADVPAERSTVRMLSTFPPR
jgi:hypothetical protein